MLVISSALGLLDERNIRALGRRRHVHAARLMGAVYHTVVSQRFFGAINIHPGQCCIKSSAWLPRSSGLWSDHWSKVYTCGGYRFGDEIIR